MNEEQIREQLTIDSSNYELYFILGQQKESLGNFAQALFCYENAVFYADKNNEEKLKVYLDNFRRTHYSLPGKVAIIIVSYENLSYTKECVKSIENTVYSESLEIIIIDNHSTDGTKEWLAQTSYKYIINEDNIGFPAACNQGILLAQSDSDIFLLNNDTLLMPNSLFCLRMALYESPDTGITGAVSNSVSNRQKINEDFTTLSEYISYSKTHNIYSPMLWEERLKLVGFAMLLKRSSLDKIGYLDEAYGLGHYEDDDLSIRFLKAGYRMLLCKDSFIYHYGNKSFGKNSQKNPTQHAELISGNLRYFIQKWGFDLNRYAVPNINFIKYIEKENLSSPSILGIGCGLGATLLEFKKLFPNARLAGVEDASLAPYTPGFFELIHINLENYNLEYQEHSFDVIF